MCFISKKALHWCSFILTAFCLEAFHLWGFIAVVVTFPQYHPHGAAGIFGFVAAFIGTLVGYWIAAGIALHVIDMVWWTNVPCYDDDDVRCCRRARRFCFPFCCVVAAEEDAAEAAPIYPPTKKMPC